MSDPQYARFLQLRRSGSDQKEQSKPALCIPADEWLGREERPEWVISGMLQRGYLYAITAPTNHGKTAISQVMALCVAAGRRFCGMEITAGNVLILCGENQDGFRMRLRATMDSLGIDIDDIKGRLWILPQAMALHDILDDIRREAAGMGEIALVLVDTSVSFFSGHMEDDNVQARDHALDLRELTLLPGHPSVVANCHPVKNATEDQLIPRGGSAFLNEIDTNLSVWSEGESANLHWFRKKRGPDFDPIAFQFQTASIGDVETVYASWIDEKTEIAMARGRNEDENKLLYAMLHHPKSSFSEWAAQCGWSGNKAKVYRVLQRLMKHQLVVKNRYGYALSKKGEDEARGVA